MSDELIQLLRNDPVVAAPYLLGGVLGANGVQIRVTEVEAYRGIGEDPGSHAFRGRTARNASMFLDAGTIYVYRSYGIHFCLNLVTGSVGSAGAILIRSGEVLAGTEQARQRRGPTIGDRDLARGPGRIGQALALTLTEDASHVGQTVSLSLSPAPILDRRVSEGPNQGEELQCAETKDRERILQGPRIGISGSGGTMEYPFRFWFSNNRYVSGSPNHPSIRLNART